MIHKGDSENAKGVYLGNKAIKKVYSGNKVVWILGSPGPEPPIPPEPPSPGFEWDETKIGVLVLNRNYEPTSPPQVTYYNNWEDAADALDSIDGGYWVHQGRLMNPIPQLTADLFSWHYYLTFIDLYQQTVIPDNCFNNAEYGNQLERITGLESITRIEDYGLFYCWALENLTIPENVSYIGEGAFGYTPIAVANIPSGITEIKDYTFQYCQDLTDVSIPNSVTSIGSCTFQGCPFTSITLPNSITAIGSNAFSYCENLESIIIPDSVTSLGDEVFYSCYALTSITLSNNITSLGWGVFAYCTSLTSINIPSNILNIDEFAFDECSSLTTITINKPVNSIPGAPWGATNATVIWTG